MNSADRRPRVTIASRIYLPERAAAAFRLGGLASALSDAGADVTVLTTTPPSGMTASGDGSGSVTVRRRPVLRDRTGYVRGYLQYLSFDVPLFFRLLAGARPDVVVVEPPPTTGLVVRLACALRRVPYVYYAADVWSDASASAAPSVVVGAVRLVESAALRGARRVLAVTEGVAERVHELGARKVDLVRNGIDTEVFRAEGPAAPAAPEGPYAVYAGTTSEWQGADVFVRAMALVLERVPDASLVFLGQGSAWSSIEAAARALPDGDRSVRMLPPVSPQDASAWLRGANAALVSLRPGQGYDFAFPTKVYAGLASGAPVLYVGPGPARATIDAEGLGRSVDYDLEAVADVLVGMLSTPVPAAERERLSRWAETHASQRSRSREAAAHTLEVAAP